MHTRKRLLQLIDKASDSNKWAYTDNMLKDAFISGSKQNMHEILDKLEAKGYVKRKVGRPGVPYNITEEGYKYYKELLK